MNIELALANLKRHGFEAVYFDTAAQAAEYVAGELKGMSVGIGGSKTVEAMGLYETLAEQGEVYWHWKQPTSEERDRAAHAQAYLSSANGISETGEIVNIDGMSNRVASTIYGHDRVVFVAGVNKLAPNLHAAIARAKNVASPLNARRFGKQTPCVLSEPMRCHDCDCPDRICRTTVIIDRKPMGIARMDVVLIGEELGY